MMMMIMMMITRMTPCKRLKVSLKSLNYLNVSKVSTFFLKADLTLVSVMHSRLAVVHFLRQC